MHRVNTFAAVLLSLATAGCMEEEFDFEFAFTTDDGSWTLGQRNDDSNLEAVSKPSHLLEADHHEGDVNEA